MNNTFIPKRHRLLAAAAAICCFSASADTVLFHEDFNGDYTESFPYIIDCDKQSPLPQFMTLFMDDAGVAQPWWRLRDSSTSTDAFIGSHSAYRPAGTSNDWLCSRAIEIPSAGFTLSFGAQSYVMRSGDRLSGLSVFITEEPVSADNLPSVAVMTIDEVSEGEDKDVIEKDFTEYKLNLDPYVGKTIYISFANLNTDKDILLIDNVTVDRKDVARLSLEYEPYYVSGEYTVKGTVTADETREGLGAYTLKFEDGTIVKSISGDPLQPGQSKDFEFKATIGADQVAEFTVTLESDGILPVVAAGSTTGLAFMPYHRVLIEEATGMWCGNCPMGVYNIEEIVNDPEMQKYAIPVSVHITGSGVDYLVDLNYSGMFGVTTAPAYRLDRDMTVRYFSTQYDLEFDPSNPLSMAGLLAQKHEETVLAGIDLSASFVTSGSEVTGIKCDVTVTPALTLEGDYRIGLIMKENNVWSEGSPLMVQTNYFTGKGNQISSHLGGWTELPEHVANVRFHDVARGIWQYRGVAGSLPDKLECAKVYDFSQTVDIPDVAYSTTINNVTYVGSPAVDPENVTMVAFLIDNETGLVVNSVAFPMTEKASTRTNIPELSGVETVAADMDAAAGAEPEYFNLSGVKVANPGPGIYIVRRGASVTKEVIR